MDNEQKWMMITFVLVALSIVAVIVTYNDGLKDGRAECPLAFFERYSIGTDMYFTRLIVTNGTANAGFMSEYAPGVGFVSCNFQDLQEGNFSVELSYSWLHNVTYMKYRDRECEAQNTGNETAWRDCATVRYLEAGNATR